MEEFKEFQINSLEEYQRLAFRTCKIFEDFEMNERHMIAGIIGEIGELTDCYKKHFIYNKPLDKTNLSEEWADIGWYIAGWFYFANEHLKSEYDENSGESLNLYEFSQNAIDEILNENVLEFDPEFLTIDYCGESFILILADVLKTTDLELLLAYWWALGDIIEIDKFEALERNILKLAFRYKEKYSDQSALLRDLDSERKILENGK